MLNIIRRKVHSLLGRVYFLSVDFGMPKISAVLLLFLIRKVNKQGVQHVLCFGSFASLDDIRALNKYSGKHQYSHFDRRYIGYIVKKYLLSKNLTEINYHTEEKFKEDQQKVYAYIDTMFPILQRFVKFSAMMTSNFGYIEQQELVRVGRDRGVPVIVLYKEGLVNPKLIDNLVTGYKTRKSQCDLFICYAPYIKSALLRNNVEGLTEDKIKVTGIPRLDHYIHQENKIKSNQLVLFSFYAHRKLADARAEDDLIKELSDLSNNFHKMLIRYAMDYPEKTVVIKTKSPYRHVKYVKTLVSEELGESISPDNLVITNEGDAMTLVSESAHVFGSNSTTLLEALLVGRSIACPDFRRFFDSSDWDVLEGYENLVNYISSYEELKRYLDKENHLTDVDMVSRQEVLEKYIYRTDGMSSERVEAYISQLFH